MRGLFARYDDGMELSGRQFDAAFPTLEATCGTARGTPKRAFSAPPPTPAPAPAHPEPVRPSTRELPP